MAAGVALTIINTRAVIEALIGYQTGFARTPKYAIGGTQKVAAQEHSSIGAAADGCLTRNWPWARIFLCDGDLRHRSYNFLAIPFLLLFVGGYYWAGCTTLWEEYQGKLEWQRQRAEVAERAEA